MEKVILIGLFIVLVLIASVLMIGAVIFKSGIEETFDINGETNGEEKGQTDEK